MGVHWTAWPVFVDFLHKLLLHHVSGFYKCSWMAAKMGCNLWWLWPVLERERERERERDLNSVGCGRWWFGNCGFFKIKELL